MAEDSTAGAAGAAGAGGGAGEPGLWWREAGPADAPLVVLVHGSMDRSGSFLPVIRRLGELRLLRYDRRGYGRSRRVGVTGLDGHVEDLVGLLAGRRAVVVGHSFGGTVALTAAARRPDLVRSVAAYEASTPWKPWYPAGSTSSMAARTEPGQEGDAAEAFMRRVVGDERWEGMPERARRDRRAEGPALVADMRSSRVTVAPYDAAALGVSVVVGYGGRSLAHHQRAARELAADIPGGEVVEVPGAGHGAHFGAPDGFAALVRRAVARAGAA